MLDYNTAALNAYQNRQAKQEREVAEWEAEHGTILPAAMDMEQAEQCVETAEEYDVNVRKPWFYQTDPTSRYEGAFNKGKELEYLKDWIRIHGEERFLKDAASVIYPKTELVGIFFGDDSVEVLDFLNDVGFREWGK